MGKAQQHKIKAVLIMKRIIFIISLLIFHIGIQLYGQTYNLITIVSEIAKINEVQHEHIGYAGSESENFKFYEQLKEIATTDELIQLTENENSTVACYASWALADKFYPDLYDILNNFLLNDRQVVTFSGCLKSMDNISSVLYHRYWNNLMDNQKATDKILFQLDSIIIFSNNPDWLILKRALGNRVYQEPYKSHIAVLAFDKGKQDAILYLSNWYKAEYVDEIKIALVKYLKETDFKKTGVTDYYRTIEELFKFKDPDIRKEIIEKMKKDRYWENDKERFKYLLSDNYIYNIDNE